jgi:signal transduction histidine kinase
MAPAWRVLHSRAMLRKLLVALVALALLFAGAWELRTIDRAADAEADRLRTALTLSANAIAHRLDDEITGVARAFALDNPRADAEEIERRLAEWRRTAAHPQFVAKLRLLDAGDEGTSSIDVRHWPQLELRPLGRDDLLVMRKPFAPELLVIEVNPRVVVPDLAMQYAGDGHELLCNLTLVRNGRTLWSSSDVRADEVVVDAGTLHGVAMWRLGVSLRRGSIAAITEASRRQKMLAAAAVLLLLAIAVASALFESRRAEEAARRQASFIAGITHELNTPIAAIGATAANLADGVVTEPAQVRRYGAAIGAEASRLGAMVANVLGTLRDRELPPHVELVEPRDLAAAAIADMHAVAEQRGFEIALIADDVLPQVQVDREQLRRALRNLLDNAIKYSGPSREVRVSVRASNGAVAIDVEDDGIGLDADDVARVGEPFYRGARARRAPAGGAGLGLALVRHIVKAHGGTLTITPRDRGSRFTVTLPVAGRE